MAKPITRNISVFSFLLFVCVISASVFAHNGSYGNYKKPKIQWSEKFIRVKALNGTVVIKEVSFTSNRDIEDVSFKVFGKDRTHNYHVGRVKFENLLNVTQATPSIEVDIETRLALSFNIPADIPEGVYKGIVRIKDGKHPVGRPLFIKLKVSQGSADLIPEEISVPTLDRVVLATDENVLFIRDQAIINLVDDADIEEVKSLVDSIGGYFEGAINDLGIYQLRFPEVDSPESLDIMIEELVRNPQVETASRATLPEFRNVPPNDSEYLDENGETEEWNENRDVFDYTDPKAALEIGRFYGAWQEVYEGIDLNSLKNVKVGILDYDFDFIHNDLVNNISFDDSSASLIDVLNKNLLGTVDEAFLERFNLVSPDDHGTNVTGIIGAEDNNNEGITGILWNADLILRQLYVSASVSAIDDIKKAIDAGAQIINLSAGSSFAETDERSAWSQFRWDQITSNYKDVLDNYCSDNEIPHCASDVLFVFAAGNPPEADENISNNFRNDLPSSLSLEYENIISVTGVSNASVRGEDNVLTLEFTLTGQGGDVDVAAPNQFWTTISGNEYGNTLNGQPISGTSFSAPAVTGLAGLLITKNPELTPKQLKDIIIAGSCAGSKPRKVPDQTFYVINAYESVKLADNPDAAKDVCNTLNPNTPPVAQNETVTVQSGTPVTINILSNDTDTDGDTLTITALALSSNGTANNNGNSVTYTSNVGFTGTDTFTYTISDGNGGNAMATVTVTVEDNVPVNSDPVALDDAASAKSGVSVPIHVLGNDTDADGDTKTITSVTQGANGSVTNNISSVTFTSNARYVGTDTFTYTISDGKGGNDTATVVVNVTSSVPPTTWSITPASVTVGENAGTVPFVITRTNSSVAQTVYVSTVQDQGSTNNGDYVGKLNEATLFAIGQDQQTVTVTINDDTTLEGNETFRLIVQQLTTDPIEINLASATFTIIDNDVPGGASGIVKLTTSLGVIVIQLNYDKAPVSSANFADYVENGFYNGTIFHRVIPGFVAQGGGFDTNFTLQETKAPIKNEADNSLKNKRGSIAMARTPLPDSATSQFFINYIDNSFLDYIDPTPSGWGYAVFGEVIEGMDVVDEMANQPTGNRGSHQDVPITNIVIEKAEIID